MNVKRIYLVVANGGSYDYEYTTFIAAYETKEAAEAEINRRQRLLDEFVERGESLKWKIYENPEMTRESVDMQRAIGGAVGKYETIDFTVEEVDLYH